MDTLRLPRDLKLDYGSYGTLIVEGIVYQTVERPWLNNAPEVSCVPPGTYIVRIRSSQKNADIGLNVVYELQNVPGRSNIEIHVANYPADVRGCIGLGTGRAFVAGQWLVVHSRNAVKMFYANMAARGYPDFTLEIS